MRSIPDAFRIPKRWTYRESAKLLGIGQRQLTYRLAAGEIKGQIEEWYTRPPGTPFAYRHRRGYISSAELVRWMKAQEAKTAAAKPARGPAIRRRSPARRGISAGDDAGYAEYGPTQ